MSYDTDSAQGRLIPIRGPGARMPEPLKRGVFFVPGAITSLGLLAGFYSLILSINGHFELAAVLIGVSFVCDALDGRIARASRTSSQFGVELDSLSDLVAFGVAPAGLAYMWALRPVAPWTWIVCGIFVICAALRLARFNVQTGAVDKNRFVGLPVPGAASVIAGGAVASSYFEIDAPHFLCVAAAILTLVLAGLMVSRVPYPSFKSLTFHSKAPVETLILVVIAGAVIFEIPQICVFLLATTYMLSGPYLMLRGERIKLPQPASVAAADKPDSSH